MKFRRKILENVEGYVPGEQPKMQGLVKLNTNENPFPPSPHVLQAVQEFSTEFIRKYPDPVSQRLREAIAQRFEYPGPEWVIVGNGLDDVLAMTIRAFVDPGDTILSPYPTYTLYETLARLHGADFRYIDLDDRWQFTGETFSVPGRLWFVPRPNAPTGVPCPVADLEHLCGSFDGLVFIDEAYADFANDNCIHFPKQFENAIVGRTFSKSYSLCGLRLGYAVAHPDIIRELMKVKDSYNVNAVAQFAGLAAFDDVQYFCGCVNRVRKNREWLTAALRDMGFTVPDSQGNFVFARRASTPTAREIFAALRERAVIVRFFDARRTDDGLRITVGSDLEIEKLLDALRDILHGSSAAEPAVTQQNG